MTKFIVPISIFMLIFLFGCSKKSSTTVVAPVTKNLQIQITNTSNQFVALNSGTYGGTAPVQPGNSMSFSFLAPMGTRLSFANMFGKSSDWFYATPDTGISLWSSSGVALSGDITSLVSLWDAGTRIDQPIDSVKADIPDTNDLVRPNLIPSYVTDSVMTISIIPKTVDAVTDSFTVTINVLSTSVTPVSPGIWAVHASGMPLFEVGVPDKGRGLKTLAQTGNPGDLFNWITPLLGVATPLSPFVVVLSNMDTVIFDSGMVAGKGLKNLAEDGNPGPLHDSLAARGFSPMVIGASVLLPGSSSSFSFSLVQGQKLYMAFMYGQSNDVFFGTSSHGLNLWPMGGNLLTGDITDSISLWDAGTEVHEYPGYGPNQAPRQSAPGMGTQENLPVTALNDGYVYGQVNKLISVMSTEQ